MLRGIAFTSTSQLVFQLWMAKPGVAGLPTKEVLVAWAAAPVLQQGQVSSLPALFTRRPRCTCWAQAGTCHSHHDDATKPRLPPLQICPGVQSLPIYRLPLLPAAQRKFTYDGAMLDFTLHRCAGARLRPPPRHRSSTKALRGTRRRPHAANP